MKRKQYRIEEEFPYEGDLFQTKVGSRRRTLRFCRQDGHHVWLTDGRRVYQRRPEQVRAVRIDGGLLCRRGFHPAADPSPARGGERLRPLHDSRLVLDRGGLHFEAYERSGVMHVEVTPEGGGRRTLVCCDFVHEVQHLKRLRIAGIRLPFRLSDF